MNYHPVANNRVFFMRTKILVIRLRRLGKLLKILTIRSYDQLTSVVCGTVETSRKLYMLT